MEQHSITEWLNDPEYVGVYNPLMQLSRSELEKEYDKLTPEVKWFIMEKKDGSKIGGIGHFPTGKLLESARGTMFYVKPSIYEVFLSMKLMKERY